jgi:mono/diheme cytochrome c family protein
MQLGNGRFACLGVAVTLLMTSAGKGAAADSANGRRIAERWCAECHVVAPGQRQASDAVPTFAEIGGSGRFDETALAVPGQPPSFAHAEPVALALRDC